MAFWSTEVARSLAALSVGGIGGLGIFFVLSSLVRIWAERTDTPLDNEIIAIVRAPAGVLCMLLGFAVAFPLVRLDAAAADSLRHGYAVMFIVSVGWFLLRGLRAGEVLLLSRYDVKAEDNLAARKIHTQIRVVKNLLLVAVLVLTSSLVLMTFQSVRHLGMSLLASAGVAGIVIGFAAQKTVGTLVAGIQLAFTQPVRLDDVVIVEGEWGRIEEITLTYVVVRIWDLRRLVVPITYFLERPFQNWTRVTADILGTVYLYTDYSAPVDAVRAELQRIVGESGLWDGKVCGLQVTDSRERVLELRALVSAADASKAWDLRCLVRERLVAFIQREHPEALPRVRASLEGDPPQTGASGTSLAE